MRADKTFLVTAGIILVLLTIGLLYKSPMQAQDRVVAEAVYRWANYRFISGELKELPWKTNHMNKIILYGITPNLKEEYRKHYMERTYNVNKIIFEIGKEQGKIVKDEQQVLNKIHKFYKKRNGADGG